MTDEKICYVIRGLPGSGKTTLAKSLTQAEVAADVYFDIENNGEFDPALLKKAHQFCYDVFDHLCYTQHPVVAVHNTFTRKWEYEDYVECAERHGYRVHVITVENHHGSSSIHNVPDNTIEKMRSRFELNL